ncbi:MAG: hypothetical protein ACON5A_05730 [Candidatus Comchoanobacterales bacterium]
MTDRNWIWEWCRMFLVYLAITISSWLVLCLISPLHDLIFFSLSLVEFLTSWSGFFTTAGIKTVIIATGVILFMVVDWYQRNRDTNSGIMFINVVKFLGSSILYALITTVVLFALPLLLVFLWFFGH